MALTFSVLLFVAGVLLENPSPIAGRVLASISVAGYRFWVVWGRSGIVMKTMTRQTEHLLNLLVAVLAFGISMSGASLTSRIDRLLVS